MPAGSMGVPRKVIRSQETDWNKVAGWLAGYVPPGKSIFYQKHMAHHFLPDSSRDWLDRLTHVFLIRDPREVISSLAKIAGDPTLTDTGLPQQLKLFDVARGRTGRSPPVIDARDVLENPRYLLRQLCDTLDVAFDEAMLAWSAGPRETDGVWAKRWYDSVLKSTGFRAHAPRANDEAVPSRYADLLDEADAIYRKLYEHRIRQ